MYLLVKRTTLLNLCVEPVRKLLTRLQFESLAARVTELRSKFTNRRNKWKDKLLQPPTPTSGDYKPTTPTSGDFNSPTPTPDDLKPPTPTSGDFKPPTPTSGDFKLPTPTTGDFKPSTPISGDF